jgi:methyl-accepting chemotaxis protein
LTLIAIDQRWLTSGSCEGELVDLSAGGFSNAGELHHAGRHFLRGCSIAAALEQQSAAVEEINANLSNVDQIAQSNASASEEITATVIELSKIADATRREVQQFQT